MAFGNPYGAYNTYKEVSIKTASKGKLVVMLYDGAVSNLDRAISLIGPDNKIQACNIEQYGKHLQKVMDIITELEVSLDLDKGGEIAKNLMALYVYFNKEILDATISHDKNKLSFIHKMLSELMESWVTAAGSTANTTTFTSSMSLNITG